jgi:predicted acetyltransferase
MEREKWQERLPYLVDRKHLMLCVDDQPMATANSLPMAEMVRGVIYPMSGVAGVASHPSARRQGYVRQVMHALLEQTSAEGQAVSTLYPFRESFYERLGYVSFPPVRINQFSPAHLASLLKTSIAGEVELLSNTEGYEIWRAFCHREQQRTHGMSLRAESEAVHFRDKGKHWVAVARQGNEILGVMLYQISGFTKDFVADRLFYTNGTGKYLLLQWIARHTDQTTTVILTTKPTDYVETWLTDLENEVKSPFIRDGYPPTPMGRVASVRDIGGMTTGPGRFTARIIDTLCPWNNGIYAFSSVEGQLVVEEATTADCDLTIQGLSALVYGGYDPGDFSYRGWGNPDTSIQTTMRQLFPPVIPFLHEWF